MGIPDSLSAMVRQIGTYTTAAKAALTAKAAAVFTADNSTAVENTTEAQLKTSADTALAAHVALKGANDPHKVTPDQVNAYAYNVLAQRIGKMIQEGMLPISRYGDLDYLPPGISGSFEGATTLKDIPGTATNFREQYSFQLEDNGKLVFLRNGVNGSVGGVYYGYVKNVLNEFVQSNFVITTKRYAPSWLPSGSSVAYLYQGGQGVLAGRLQDGSGTLGLCFVAITNGTLDAAQHKSVFLPASWDSLLNTMEVVRCGSYLYFLVSPEVSYTSNSAPVELAVYRLAISALDNASTVTPTQVTIAQTTGFRGAVNTSSGKITLAAAWNSVNAGDSALFYHVNNKNPGQLMDLVNIQESGGGGRIMTTSIYDATTDTIRILSTNMSQFANNGRYLNLIIEYSFTLNCSTLVAALDSGLVPVTLTAAADGSSLTYSGNLARVDSYSWTNLTGFDRSTRWYLSDAGWGFVSRIAHTQSDQDTMARFVLPANTSLFNAIKCPLVAAPTGQWQAVPLNFGSAVGDSFDGVRLLPDNQVITLSRGQRFGYVKARYANSGAQAPAPNMTYSSLQKGSLSGFAPQLDRAALGSDDPYRLMLNELDANGAQAFGTVVNDLFRQSSYVTLNADLSTSGSISVTQAQLTQLKSAIVALTSYTLNQGSVELVVPQTTNTGAWACLSMVTSTGQHRLIVAAVGVSSRNGAIATLTANAILVDFLLSTGVGSPVIAYESNDSRRCGNHFIYKQSDGGYMVVGTPMACFEGNNYAKYAGYRFYIQPNGSVVGAGGQGFDWSISLPRLGAFPGYGVGYFEVTDYATKLMFRSVATTQNDFTGWSNNAVKTTFVVTSQDVAQGFNLYFTEATPVLFNGEVVTLPAGVVNLSTINASPGNKTFYLYVEYASGAAKYVISEQLLAETYQRMYVGKVVTGAAQISSIVVDKVTKLDNYRLSKTGVGMAIPATNKQPSQPSSLSNW